MTVEGLSKNNREEATTTMDSNDEDKATIALSSDSKLLSVAVPTFKYHDTWKRDVSHYDFGVPIGGRPL